MQLERQLAEDPPTFVRETPLVKGAQEGVLPVLERIGQSVPPEALEGDPAAKAPVELIGLVDQALAPSEQDGSGPVPAGERETIRTLGRQVLGALWGARARR